VRPAGPLVGVSAIVVRGEALLLARRRGAHGAATWSPAGGHVDAGEAPAAAAARELLEETGLVAATITAVGWTSDVFAAEGLHYVTLHHLVVADGEPALLEPDKAEGWSWHPWHALPSPLFAPVASLVASGWSPRAASGPTLAHVQLAAPPGCEPQARRFFGELLALPELPKPEALRARGGVWFGLGDQQLHVGVEAAFAPARKAHPALRLREDELDAVAVRLGAAGAQVTWDAELAGVRRFSTADPWGNRLELIAAGRAGALRPGATP
jgi:8-oxo-dGTP diphosphatase